MAFAQSSQDLHIATKDGGLFLFCRAQTEDGDWQATEINLDEFIGNEDGIILLHCPVLSKLYLLIPDTRMVRMGRCKLQPVCQKHSPRGNHLDRGLAQGRRRVQRKTGH